MNDFDITTRVPFVTFADELEAESVRPVVRPWDRRSTRCNVEVPFVMQEEGEA